MTTKTVEDEDEDDRSIAPTAALCSLPFSSNNATLHLSNHPSREAAD